jgi:hypothetical protein
VDAGLLVRAYLFRDQNSTNTFAYTLDVTGRNIPRHTARIKWTFVATTWDHEMPEGEEAMRHLRRSG